MDIVIGLGETGLPLYNILKRTYRNTIGVDKKDKSVELPDSFKGIRYMNVCIPYSDKFVDIVKEYQDRYMPYITIIHSTVPIGTTSQFNSAVHSPILGRHNEMETEIMKYQKWVGGTNNMIVAAYLCAAGINCRLVDKSSATEALKLMCLAKYGMSIAFAQYQKGIADTYGFPYEEVVAWDLNYNRNVSPDLQRPILQPCSDKIGGHCIIPNTELLNNQHPNQILDEILRYK